MFEISGHAPTLRLGGGFPGAKPGGNLVTKPQTGSFCCENRMIFLSANFTAALPEPSQSQRAHPSSEDGCAGLAHRPWGWLETPG